MYSRRKLAVHVVAETPDHLVALRDLRNFVLPNILIHPIALFYKSSGGVMRIFFEFLFESALVTS